MPYFHYLTYSNSINKHKIFINTDTAWNTILQEYYTNKVYHIPPDGTKEILIIDDNNSVSVDMFRTPGFHSLQTDNIEIENTAVNNEKCRTNNASDILPTSIFR